MKYLTAPLKRKIVSALEEGLWTGLPTPAQIRAHLQLDASHTDEWIQTCVIVKWMLDPNAKDANMLAEFRAILSPARPIESLQDHAAVAVHALPTTEMNAEIRRTLMAKCQRSSASRIQAKSPVRPVLVVNPPAVSPASPASPFVPYAPLAPLAPLTPLAPLPPAPSGNAPSTPDTKFADIEVDDDEDFACFRATGSKRQYVQYRKNEKEVEEEEEEKPAEVTINRPTTFSTPISASSTYPSALSAHLSLALLHAPAGQMCNLSWVAENVATHLGTHGVIHFFVRCGPSDNVRLQGEYRSERLTLVIEHSRMELKLFAPDADLSQAVDLFVSTLQSDFLASNGCTRVDIVLPSTTHTFLKTLRRERMAEGMKLVNFTVNLVNPINDAPWSKVEKLSSGKSWSV